MSELFPPNAPAAEPEQVERDAEVERQRRILLHQAEQFYALSLNPEFQLLQQQLQAKVAKVEAEFSQAVLRTAELTPETIYQQATYNRGFIDGIGYSAQVIEMARKLIARLQEEEESEAPVDDPGGF